MRQIREYVEAMFSTLPKTKEVLDIRLQILEHMEDKFEALRGEGMSESEALGNVILEFGSIDEIKAEFGIYDEAPAPVPRDEELDRLLREYDAFVPRMHMAVALAVILFILAPIASMASDSILLMFVMVALGVGLLIYFVGRKGDYRTLIMERKNMSGLLSAECEFGEADRYPGASRRRRQLYSLLPLVAVIFYLIIGFQFDLWHPGWLIFLLVPVIIGILEFLRIE